MIAVAMVALLQESHRDAPVPSVTELNHDVARLIYMVGTPIVADTYTNLTGSEDLALIRSQETQECALVLLRTVGHRPARIEHA